MEVKWDFAVRIWGPGFGGPVGREFRTWELGSGIPEGGPIVLTGPGGFAAAGAGAPIDHLGLVDFEAVVVFADFEAG